MRVLAGELRAHLQQFQHLRGVDVLAFQQLRQQVLLLEVLVALVEQRVVEGSVLELAVEQLLA